MLEPDLRLVGMHHRFRTHIHHAIEVGLGENKVFSLFFLMEDNYKYRCTHVVWWNFYGCEWVAKGALRRSDCPLANLFRVVLICAWESFTEIWNKNLRADLFNNSYHFRKKISMRKIDTWKEKFITNYQKSSVISGEMSFGVKLHCTH